MPETPCTVPGCSARPGMVRHQHPCPDLNAIGETCWTCKIADWALWFGGPLPAFIRCRQCGKGFNLSQRLMATTGRASRGME